MIKFFRHIRQRLVTENKFSKYLLYAIGEIILVVIGILIALQINTWNENRKLENSKEKLMVALKQEFKINKNVLEQYVKGLHTNNAHLNQVVNFSAGAEVLPIDSLRLYASNLYYPTTLSMLTTVLDESISAGKFEMLSDSLKQKLSLLKDYTKSREAVSKNFEEKISSNNDEFNDIFFKLSAIPEVPKVFYVQQPIAMHPDFVISDDEFVQLIKSSKTYAQLTQIYLASTMDEIWIKYGLLRLTTETIGLIDKELKD
ncbi:DUF6090 family protein [Rasiella sp. SM2506]|uniref:DUF6090 family protein n=1 Tax=Rasiella sp. SM2506 TaxID=3423914 RepID=UPI003D78D9D4